jgi:SNF2 family DNA or RNA helicase
VQLYRLLLTGTPLQNNLHELWAVLHVLLPDYFTSADAFDEAVDVANHRVDAERLESARQLLGHFMLRRTKEVVGLPRKYETLVPCPLAPLQASWYKRLLSSDTATASVLTVSQLKTLIMQLRKICNHPRTLLGSAKDTAAAAAAGAAAAAAVSSSSSSKTPMGGGGKRGERLRQELAALTGEELMQASGKLLVLDRLLERLFKLESRALIFSTFTQTLDVLAEWLSWRGITFSRMDGQTNPIQRELDVRDFNADGSPTKVFLISTRAGGVGINLASADVVILFDSDWNPQVDLQVRVESPTISHDLLRSPISSDLLRSPPRAPRSPSTSSASP